MAHPTVLIVYVFVYMLVLINYNLAMISHFA